MNCVKLSYVRYAANIPGFNELVSMGRQTYMTGQLNVQKGFDIILHNFYVVHWKPFSLFPPSQSWAAKL
jgi:hypothetical protein